MEGRLSSMKGARGVKGFAAVLTFGCAGRVVVIAIAL
jgi:hypothetical protein